MKSICLMAFTAFAISSVAGCGDSGSGGNGGGSVGGGSDGGASAGGSNEGGAPTVNGCTKDGATDETTSNMVDIDWKIPTQSCIRVKTGTTVNWNVTAPATFGSHPLKGGKVPGPPEGPISDSDQTGATASVTFDTAGEYPFYCEIHLTSMQGVIYVE